MGHHVVVAVARNRPTDQAARAVVVVYVVLTAAPFVFAATHAWFWNHHHSVAPIAAGLVGLLLVALVLRQRWTWMILVIFDGFVVISYAWEWSGAVTFVVNLAAFALLLSPPMRRYVGARALRVPRPGKTILS